MSSNPIPIVLDEREASLARLGGFLGAADYEFVAVTPLTHRKVNQRDGNVEGWSLRDIFGWNRRFQRQSLSPDAWNLARDADVLAAEGDFWKSRVRWATCEGQLFVHSSFPTDASSAVFFGPDSYRFVALLDREVGAFDRLVDVGCGSGVGALALARRGREVILTDINPFALRFAAVNAVVNGLQDRVSMWQSDILAQVPGSFDVIVSNPPYLADPSRRVYRHGGGTWGCDLSVRIVRESLGRLRPGGKLVLYSGTPCVGGKLVLREALSTAIEPAVTEAWSWRELDPDVFSEELEEPPYDEAERIAVVAMTFTSPPRP